MTVSPTASAAAAAAARGMPAPGGGGGSLPRRPARSAAAAAGRNGRIEAFIRRLPGILDIGFATPTQAVLSSTAAAAKLAPDPHRAAPRAAAAPRSRGAVAA